MGWFPNGPARVHGKTLNFIAINLENVMRNFILTLAAAFVVFATPAFAGSITGEVKFGNPVTDRKQFQEYGLNYNDSNGVLAYGGELTTKQGEHQGSVGSKFSGRLGPALPEVFGFQPAVYAELGRSFAENDDYNFYGVGAKVSHKIVGPVDANVGYRYRKGFDADDLVESRTNAGVSVNVTKTFVVGANYYWYRGAINNDAVGVSLTQKF